MSVLLTVLALTSFGMVIGALSGTLGVGGGIFMVPFMTLALGFSQQEAQATSLLVVLPTSLVALVTLKRRGIEGSRLGLRMGIVGAVLSLAGAFLAVRAPDRALEAVFGTVLLIVAVRMLVVSRDSSQPENPG